MSRSALAVLLIYFLKSLGNVVAVPTAGESASDPCKNYISYVCKDANTETTLNYWRRYPDIKNSIRNIDNTKVLTQAELKYFDLTKYCGADLTLQDKKDLIQSFNFPKYNKGLLSDKFDFEGAIAELLSAGIQPLYSFTLSTAPTFQNRLKIDRLDFMYPMNTHYDFRRSLVTNEALFDYIENKDEVINDSTSVMGTYFSLKHQYESREEITDIKGLKEKIPEYDWDSQITAYFGQKLPDDYPVHIHNFELVKRFITATMNMPSKVIANYLLLKLAESVSVFDMDLISGAFEEVEYQFTLKQLYSDANRKDLRIMLHSFLETIQKIGKLSNNDTQFEYEASEFINKDILPHDNDDFLSNMYKDIEITPNKCLSNFYKLGKIANGIHYKRRLERRNDFLNHLQYSLKNSLTEHLPFNLHKTSPYKFLSFFWQAAKTHGNLQRTGVNSYNHLMQCFKEQNNELYSDYDLPTAAQTQILIKAYFAWMKSNEKFVHSEEQEFHFNAKAYIFENFIIPYCSGNTPTQLERYSNYIENLDEFSEVYNCPNINSKFPNKCQLR